MSLYRGPSRAATADAAALRAELEGVVRHPASVERPSASEGERRAAEWRGCRMHDYPEAFREHVAACARRAGVHLRRGLRFRNPDNVDFSTTADAVGLCHEVVQSLVVRPGDRATHRK
jgi:hypothetical protein